MHSLTTEWRGLRSTLVFAIFMCVWIISQSASAQTPTERWTLVWNDEFNEPLIDTSKWNFEVDCWGGGNEEQQCYTDAAQNVSIQDGKLVITARIEDTTGAALPVKLQHTEVDKEKVVTKPFTSGRLTTKNKGDWKYGRIEVRAKLPTGQGTWPAIWMLPTDNVYGGWPLSGEIDIMEAVNLGANCLVCDGAKENRILGTLHYGRKWPKNTHKGKAVERPASKDGFHVYGVEWREGEISWFIDGELFQTQTSKTWYTKGKNRRGQKHAPFDQRFHMILNLAIGGRWPEGANEGGVSLDGFPKDMQVDWVRVYACASDPKTGKACTKRD